MNLIYEYFRKYCAWSGLFIWRQGSLWWQYFDKTPPLLCLILKDKLLQFKRGLSWKQEINKPRLQNNPAQTKVCISSLKSKLKLLRDKNIMLLSKGEEPDSHSLMDGLIYIIRTLASKLTNPWFSFLELEHVIGLGKVQKWFFDRCVWYVGTAHSQCSPSLLLSLQWWFIYVLPSCWWRFSTLIGMVLSSTLFS